MTAILAESILIEGQDLDTQITVVDAPLDGGVDVTVLVPEIGITSTEVITDVVEVFGGIKGDRGDPGPPGTAVADPEQFGTVINVASPISGETVLNHNLLFTPGGFEFFDASGRPCGLTAYEITTTTFKVNPFVPFSGYIVVS